MKENEKINEEKFGKYLENLLSSGAIFNESYIISMDKCCKEMVNCKEEIQQLYENYLRKQHLFKRQDEMKEFNFDFFVSSCSVAEKADSVLKNYSLNLYMLFSEIKYYGNNNEARNKWYDFWLEKIKDFYPHKIGFTKQGWLYLSIPQLLPKKVKEYGNSGSLNWLTEMLSKVFEQFLKQKYTYKYKEKCILVYRYVYSENIPNYSWFDYDNLESRQVTNYIAEHFLFDDSPKYIDTYYTTGVTKNEHSFTEVYLVPKRQFNDFLCLVCNDNFEGFQLSETYSGLCEYIVENNS